MSLKTASLALCLVAYISFANNPLLAEGPSKDATKYQKQIELFARSNRARAIQDIISEMAGSEEPRIVALLPVAGTALPSSANFAAAVEAIEKLKSDAAVEVLVGALRKKGDYRQRVLILEAFGKRGDNASLAAITEQLEASVDNVQVAAMRAARARKERTPIPALIRILEKDWKAHDRVWNECRLALVDLTGKDFDSIADWKNFWASVQASFDPKKVGHEKGPTRIAVKPTKESVEFFGTEIFSRSLVFVIDVSGSMLMYDEPRETIGTDDPEGDGEKAGGTTVTGSSKGRGSGAGKGSDPEGHAGEIEQDRQRLRRAKEQLTRALRKLSRATQFNIITFSDKILPWQKRLQPATPANIAAAVKFVNEFQARGATHTDEALEIAFGDLAVDTIVLLSDGAPVHRSGSDSRTLIQRILEKIRDINSARKVIIHTFGFEGEGRWPEKGPKAGGQKLPPAPTPEEVKTFLEFLKSLARENGGEFRAIR